ncbi:MAG: PhzF family phenazine biosynthesis protein [Acidobacteriota bacterium]
MKLPIYQVDAFTEKAFAGNPAAVCLLESSLPDSLLQSIAAEMNLSETAFLKRHEDGFQLRWFTPSVEVDLCGHATLASAHVLWQTKSLAPEAQARFHTRSGLLTAIQREGKIELDFPAKVDEPTEPPSNLTSALGLTPQYVGRNEMDYLIEVESEDVVRRLKPDFKQLRSVGLRGVIVTSRSASPEFDFVSRFFAPGSGIDEDPVTGSAHCCLGPYWARKLRKTQFTAFQASARGGVVYVRLEGQRVLLGGQAVTVLRGELDLPA